MTTSMQRSVATTLRSSQRNHMDQQLPSITIDVSIFIAFHSYSRKQLNTIVGGVFGGITIIALSGSSSSTYAAAKGDMSSTETLTLIVSYLRSHLFGVAPSPRSTSAKNTRSPLGAPGTTSISFAVSCTTAAFPFTPIVLCSNRDFGLHRGVMMMVSRIHTTSPGSALRGTLQHTKVQELLQYACTSAPHADQLRVAPMMEESEVPNLVRLVFLCAYNALVIVSGFSAKSRPYSPLAK
ncbi:hypothetical protein EDB19DRAFT_990450 [Suillus lakei]|nr:hypothetical protein EDB19DRAFT_990450 [Suillus lakei]